MTHFRTKTVFSLAALVALGVSNVATAETTLNWAIWDYDSTPYYQPLIDAYEAANPDVKIEVTDLGSSDYNQMIMTQLTGGSNEIDVVTIKDIPGYAKMVSTGRLKNLTEIGATPEDTAAYGGLIETLELGGGVYGLPFRTDFWIVYYNKDHFDAAGVDYPTNDMTWAEFDEKARAVTSGFGVNKIYGTHLHTWRSTVQLPAIQNGETTLVADDYTFLKPWYKRALSLQEDGVIRSYGSLKTSQTHYSGPFFNSQIAMLPMGSWFIGTQINKVASGESSAANWGITSYPTPEGVQPGATSGQVTSLGINVNSTQGEAAEDFIQWVSGPDGAAIMASVGNIPALRDNKVMDTITSREGFPQDETSAGALITSATYLEMPVHPQAAEYELVLNRVHDALMTENISIEDAIKEMNDGVAAID
ncbi:MAG: sugar ABC transporter substrate-binding protein [Hyphomicrobiales bacterium]